jgi:hypothetical protein
LVGKVCDYIIGTDSFRTLTTQGWNIMSTRITSRTSSPLELPPAEELEFPSCEFLNDVPKKYGFQTCELFADDASFVLVLRPCFQRDDSKIYLLSHGYEHEHLFFIFGYDSVAKEMTLEAYVKRESGHDGTGGYVADQGFSTSSAHHASDSYAADVGTALVASAAISHVADSWGGADGGGDGGGKK